LDNEGLILECQLHITQGYSDENQHIEARIYMKLVYKNGITKKNTLWYYDGDPIIPFFKQSNYASNIRCDPHLLKKKLASFDPRTTEMRISCSQNSFHIQSHWDEYSAPFSKLFCFFFVLELMSYKIYSG
jgi:hypothetical protein